MNLLNATIAAAAANVLGPVLQFRRQTLDKPRSLVLQGNFTYGSGGTTVDAWVQSTVDGGATWFDIANFRFTTASLRGLLNISTLTAIAATYTATDGTLAANTTKDGLLGEKLRVKYTSVGTYAGGTSLLIDCSPGGMMS